MDEAAGRLQGGDTATLRSTGSYQGVGVEGGRRKRLQSLEVIRFELGRCEVGGTNGPFRISRRTADGSRPVRLRTGQQRNEGGSQQYVQSWPFVVAISSAKGQSCRSPALHRHGHAVTEGGSAGSPSRLGVSVNWLVGGQMRGAAIGAAAGGEGDTSFRAWLSGHGISAYSWCRATLRSASLRQHSRFWDGCRIHQPSLIGSWLFRRPPAVHIGGTPRAH